MPIDDHQPSVEELLAQIRSSRYESPLVDQMNPELRSAKNTSPTAYGLTSFNLEAAVQAFAEGKVLDVARRVKPFDKNETILTGQKDKPSLGKRVLGVVVAWRPKEAWYVYDAMELCEAEGSRMIGKYESRLATSYEFFSLWEFSDIENVELMIMRLDALDF